jgi:hypothetical protein
VAKIGSTRALPSSASTIESSGSTTGGVSSTSRMAYEADPVSGAPAIVVATQATWKPSPAGPTGLNAAGSIGT